METSCQLKGGKKQWLNANTANWRHLLKAESVRKSQKAKKRKGNNFPLWGGLVVSFSNILF